MTGTKKKSITGIRQLTNDLPIGELPALQNGSVWVSRFQNIVDYLRQYSEGAWNLDQNLDKVQRADSVAYATPTSTTA